MQSLTFCVNNVVQLEIFTQKKSKKDKYVIFFK